MTDDFSPQTGRSTMKATTKKEMVVHELKEIFAIMIYLAASLSLLATIKSLVLVQQGINDFAHSYEVALIMALGAAKVVVLVQDRKLMKAWDHKPLFYAVLYKSTLMSVIVEMALKAEEHLFNHHNATIAAAHPIVLSITHQTVLFLIFAALFTVRGLDRELGPGKLKKLFFGQPDEQNLSSTIKL